ncbi:hypothetical protein ACYZX9_00435 [Sphingomonas citri]|jgi:hypothetical protein|uniref:Uncharacterized protein n=1 Tax=Sphingomonas citri TaxID=2862499 RepID=A0ABS7BJH3_9SPHN|nr:hypothetical protein [Sphingomonas citri]MBW6529754.1 hypothetical protein [Sphingomonas citri]
MSMIADAMKTIQSVLLLQAKVERLEDELRETRGQMKQMANAMIAIDRRVVRLETFEEMRTGRPAPRLEG